MNCEEKIIELNLVRKALSKTEQIRLQEPMLGVQRDDDGLTHISITRLAERGSGIVGITTSICLDPSKF